MNLQYDFDMDDYETLQNYQLCDWQDLDTEYDIRFNEDEYQLEEYQ